MTSTRSAVLHSSVTRYTMTLISFASTVLVARLLTPSEIGTFSVASSVAMIMTEFRMLGAGGYVIREKHLTPGKVKSALGLTIIISWTFGLAILGLAIPAAHYFDIPPLSKIFAILSIGFFFAPYTSISFALHSRNMNFRVQMVARLIGSIVNFATTIGLILAGFSYYALAIGFTAMEVALFVAIAVSSWPRDMVLLPHFRNLREVASFGVFSSLANFFRKFTTTVPDIVIGKMGSTAQVAMYSRGLGFIQFIQQTPIMGVAPVSLPYLSNARKNNQDVGEAYTLASVLLGAIVCPVLGVASLCSHPAIRVFFGPQWDMAAPLASALAFWGIFRTIHWFGNDCLLATGRERLVAFKEMLCFAVLLPGIVLGYHQGLQIIAFVFIAVGCLDFSLSSYFLSRSVGVRFGRFLWAWRSNIVTTLVCMFTTWVIGEFVPFSAVNSWKPILTIALILPPVWIMTLALTANPLFKELLNVVARKKK